MAQNQVTLARAAFADSPHARALSVPAADAATIVERFLTVCFDELGKIPRLLDGDDVRTALGRLLPGHFAPQDRLLAHAPTVLDAYFDHLAESEVVPQLFELRQALPDALMAFTRTVEAGGEGVGTRMQRDAPFVHGAKKLGRNDPCSCGSGKKYKACHGKPR